MDLWFSYLCTCLSKNHNWYWGPLLSQYFTNICPKSQNRTRKKMLNMPSLIPGFIEGAEIVRNSYHRRVYVSLNGLRKKFLSQWNCWCCTEIHLHLYNKPIIWRFYCMSVAFVSLLQLHFKHLQKKAGTCFLRLLFSTVESYAMEQASLKQNTHFFLVQILTCNLITDILGLSTIRTFFKSPEQAIISW